MLFQDMITSLLRFIPLFIFASIYAQYGIFTSWGLSLFVATMTGILVFIPITQRGYNPKISINKNILGKMVQFSLSNYLVTMFGILPSSILPLIVLNRLGADQNAYFYISWTISNIIAMVPSAVNTSLFAEGANDTKTLNAYVKRSLIFTSLLLIPLLGIILIFGKWLLVIFGAKYSQNATTLLKILSVTALPLSINLLYYTIKRIQKRMKNVVMLTGLISIVVIGFTNFLLRPMGLIAAGIVWLGANTLVALFITGTWLKNKSLL
jgi:O-antigen/teichoic acid export membrane protein